ncbi:hypothetical protein U0070_021361 [Myodes glareolus]|uniref:Uncharacterized protein n=1 Tax=Myodes glareolus TaxID=447135 RepID=A0AAW0JIL9_MYOGA
MLAVSTSLTIVFCVSYSLKKMTGYLWHLHGRHREDVKAENFGAIVANHEPLQLLLVHREGAGFDVEQSTKAVAPTNPTFRVTLSPLIPATCSRGANCQVLDDDIRHAVPVGIPVLVEPVDCAEDELSASQKKDSHGYLEGFQQMDHIGEKEPPGRSIFTFSSPFLFRMLMTPLDIPRASSDGTLQVRHVALQQMLIREILCQMSPPATSLTWRASRDDNLSTHFKSSSLLCSHFPLPVNCTLTKVSPPPAGAMKLKEAVLGKQKQTDLCEINASLVNIVNCRSARALK